MATSCFHPPRREGASILIGLLWCVALLSVVVVGVLHTSRMDLLVTKNYGDRIQAHYLALAGIEKAEALLYQNARDRSRSGKNHTGDLYSDDQQFRDVAFGRGQFRVFRRGRPDEGGGIIYGVGDEESRLNVNVATTNELQEIDGMTADIAASIIDWRDPDNEVSPGGAEKDYYASLQPPYQPRNGPIETVRELLMVRGVSPDLLLAKDVHQNGLLEDAGEGENGSLRDNPVGDEDTGWAGIMTVDSSVRNVSATGQDRVNIQTADESSLTAVQGVSPAIARAIVAYRGQNTFQSIADLLDVTPPQGQGSTNQADAGVLAQQSGGAGARVISEDLLMEIADDLTADSNQEHAGAININTAGLDVLRCLPGIDRELAQAIVSYRQSSGFFPNIAWLLKVPGMTHDILKQVAPLISARSETYRILSEGRINSSGTRQRIQAIVHIGLNDLTTISYREDDL